ncbi:MAG TPA: hypothetical protein VKA53_08165, partial [Thermoanaerobaculia bacterium]|nr:hypothetical protein [Thermoanaerobaculia bacterium]
APTEPSLPERATATTGRCRGAQYRSLDPLIGHWQTKSSGREGGGSPPAVRADAEVVGILDGCSVEQRLRISTPVLPRAEIYVVLAWDAGAESWVAYSISSTDGTMERWTGTVKGRELDLKRTEPDGALHRWRWSWSSDGTAASIERARHDRGGGWTQVFSLSLARVSPPQ